MTTPSTTSQKHREFAGEPMRDKPVEDLAGIGPVLASRLKEQGFTKVNNYIYLGTIFQSSLFVE